MPGKKTRVEPASDQSFLEEVISEPALDLRFLELTGTDLVELTVGPEKTLFRVHKDLLCNKVPYFDKMFNGGFAEASDNKANFPEDSPESIDLLIEWIYTDRIRRLEYIKVVTPLFGVVSADLSYDPIELYALAQKFCIPKLMDQTLDVFRTTDRIRGSTMGPLYMQRAYEKTQEKTGMRLYALDSMLYKFFEGRLTPRSDAIIFTALVSANFDLGVDFFRRMQELEPGATVEDPSRGDNCIYHSHKKDEQCLLEENKAPV